MSTSLILCSKRKHYRYYTSFYNTLGLFRFEFICGVSIMKACYMFILIVYSIRSHARKLAATTFSVKWLTIEHASLLWFAWNHNMRMRKYDKKEDLLHQKWWGTKLTKRNGTWDEREPRQLQSFQASTLLLLSCSSHFSSNEENNLCLRLV